MVYSAHVWWSWGWFIIGFTAFTMIQPDQPIHDMSGYERIKPNVWIYIYIWYDHVWIWTIRLTAHVHQMLLGQQMGRLPISSGTQEIRKWIQVTRLNYPDQMTSNYYPLTKQCCDGPSQCWTMLNMFDLLLCMADFHLQNAPKNSLHGTRPSLCWTLRTQRLEFAHNTAE